MKCQLLVIDDQILDRRVCYERLIREAEKSAGVEINLVCIERPEELSSILANYDFTIALVDAVLEDNWEGFDLRWAMGELPSDLPVALVSSRWDLTNARAINFACEQENFRYFFYWRDIQSDTDGFRYAVALLVKLISERRKILTSEPDFSPNKPIRIVHLSDLQFGGFNPDTVELEATSVAEAVLDHCAGERPSFIALTGDITEAGLPTQFEAATKWLEHFCGRLGYSEIPKKRILLCPGNHDINASLASASQIDFEIYKEGETEIQKKRLRFNDHVVFPELRGYGLKPFKEFVNSVSDHLWIDEESWIETRFQHQGVVFYGLQTVRSSDKECFLREVNPQSLDRVQKSIRSAIPTDSTRPLVIGIGHHCPVAVDGSNGIRNHAAMSVFFGNSVKTGLFLYGHVHDGRVNYKSGGGPFRLVHCPAPTSTKRSRDRPEDTLRGFHLYELKRENQCIKELKVIEFVWRGQAVEVRPSHSYMLQQDGMFKEP